MSYTWPVVTLFSPFPIETCVRLRGSPTITKFYLTGREKPELVSDAPICEKVKTLRLQIFTKDDNKKITCYTFEVKQCSGKPSKVSLVFLMNVPEVFEGHSFCRRISLGARRQLRAPSASTA